MSYRIVYAGTEPSRSGTGFRKGRFIRLLAGFFLLFCLLTKVCWPDGSEMMSQLLFSGDPEVTVQAVSVFMQALRAGEDFTDAAMAFCLEITEHAENPG